QPCSTLFPYTTLFRSRDRARQRPCLSRGRAAARRGGARVPGWLPCRCDCRRRRLAVAALPGDLRPPAQPRPAPAARAAEEEQGAPARRAAVGDATQRPATTLPPGGVP